MNKKIKELMERVRLTDEELDAAWDSIPLYTEDDVGRKFAIANSQLNKVLNDKDLALIDRDKKPDNIVTWNFDVGKVVTDVKRNFYKAGFTHSIIPLADALKGKK